MTATTCDTGTALLRAVLADPASDDCRLILADWYEENGQADRGEFVRVQCQIAALSAELMSDEDCDATNCPGCGERRELQRRQRELMDAITPYRTADGRAGQSPARVLWARPAVWNGCGVKFSRGFVSEIRLPLALYLAHARDLFAAHPITTVVISDREPVERAAGRWSWDWDTAEATSWNRILFGLAMAADPNVVMAWPTPEETRRVLSGYLVNSGRKLAGLPPLG
jgi:uncharacterized protein (TIGR02996 family)